LSQLYNQIEKNILMELKEEILKSNLNIFILTSIKSLGEQSGYDVLQNFRKKFEVNISVGTIYSQLYALERKKLIEGQLNSSGVRKYILTVNGLKTLDIIIALKPQILDLFDSVFTF
jgi:DNA-binding PadR family transcriptional regulator